MAALYSHRVANWLIYLSFVRLLVEIGEQEIEQHCMGTNEIGKVNRIIALVVDQQLERMQHDQHKLDHLQQRQIFLPPQILLHFGSHCGQHIVRVHDDVHERI